MKNYKFFIIILTIITLCCGCGFKQEIEITPRYFVIQVDVADDKDICYKLYNGDYIGLLGGGLSKLYQKGNTLIAIKTIKKREIIIKEYYIIPLYNHDTLDPDIGIKGPLTKTELDTQLSKNDIKVSQFVELDIE